MRQKTLDLPLANHGDDYDNHNARNITDDETTFTTVSSTSK